MSNKKPITAKKIIVIFIGTAFALWVLPISIFTSKLYTPSFESLISESCSEYRYKGKISPLGLDGPLYEGHPPVNAMHVDLISEMGDDLLSVKVDALYAGPILESNMVKCVADGLDIPLSELPVSEYKPLSYEPYAYGCQSADQSLNPEYACFGGYLWPTEPPKTITYTGIYDIKIDVTGEKVNGVYYLTFSKSK